MKKFLLWILIALMGMTSIANAEGLTDFFTHDMEGNEVTEEIFAPYDLTMVNVWATWCSYCLMEMPEFNHLVEMLPENVNFITLCDDAAFEYDLAKEILDACDVQFQTLISTNDIYKQFLYQVSSFPTTFFVDSEGNVVGKPIVGVPSLTNTAEAYYDILMKQLEG